MKQLGVAVLVVWAALIIGLAVFGWVMIVNHTMVPDCMKMLCHLT